MEINYMDILVSTCQSILIVYIISYCFGYNKILNSRRLVLCIIVLACNGYFIPNILGNYSIYVFATHFISMVVIVFFFKNNYIEALVAYNLIYALGAVWLLMFGGNLYNLLEPIVLKKHVEMFYNIYIYISQLIFYSICIKYINKIKQINKMMQAEKFTKSCIIIMSFIPDFSISLCSSLYNNEAVVYQKIKVVMLMMFIGFSIVYFIKVKERADKIFKLNETLGNKNSELKKIKSDYGMQMSSLYELCLREKYEEVANLLKSIINTPNNSDSGEKRKFNESLLSLATKHVVCDDVKIIIEDNASLELMPMSEMELYRIIVNIVNNAIKAMKNKGTLTAKSFNKSNDIVIEIENDGEKIPEKYICKIFESGFTTKNDNDKNHGYGLCIVKELIESYNGNIFVRSDDLKTKFTIILPQRYRNAAVDL